MVAGFFKALPTQFETDLLWVVRLRPVNRNLIIHLRIWLIKNQMQKTKVYPKSVVAVIVTWNKKKQEVRSINEYRIIITILLMVAVGFDDCLI